MKAALALSAVTAAAGSLGLAPAPSSDWQIVRSGRTVVASLHAADGGVAVGCDGGVLDVRLSGLPVSHQDVRALRVALDEGRFSDQTWTVGQDRATAHSHLPARLARQLRQTGRLQVMAGDTAGRLHALTLELPRSDAVDQALAACGKPLVDARDQVDPWVPLFELPYHLEWAEQPAASFPRHAMQRGMLNGHAIVTCKVGHAGAVQDCRVESEFPTAARIGRSTVAALHRARLRSNPAEPDAAAGEVFAFRASWRDGPFRGVTASRLGGPSSAAALEDSEDPHPLPRQ